MRRAARIILLSVMVTLAHQPEVFGQIALQPDTVVVRSGTLHLRALLWRPTGSGPFPSVLFNHGSSGKADSLPVETAALLGPVFAKHGYVFLLLFRRGIGLSAEQGVADGDLMAQALRTGGVNRRNQVQLDLLKGEELSEVAAGLTYLREISEVDIRRLAVVGHSFGGSLTLLLAERDTTIRAAVVFGGAARSWPLSPELRVLLSAAARHSAPVLFVHAANDYSTAPGRTLARQMQHGRRPHRLKIYAASGRTPNEGHNFLYHHVPTWENDVFAFLDSRLR